MAATAARIAEVLAGLRAASARLGTAAQVRRAHLPLGLAGLDQALGGGLPRGKLIELTGARSSGRMTIALGAIVEAQRAGELAAIVDAADAFDPRSAHAAGVVLPRLLWVRPAGFLGGLQAADRVLDAGGFGLLVVYLAGVALTQRLERTPRHRKIPSGGVGAPAWARLQQRAEKSSTAVLLVAEHPLAGSFAVATLEARRGRATWTGLLDGIESTVLIVRSKLGAPGGIVELVRAA
jgi:RecA/RadA recombinase